jgi:hypothetical protein
LKGRRDRIPALRRKGRWERKRPEKISHFYLEQKTRKINFVVPKVKSLPSWEEELGGKSSLKL